MVIHYSAKSDVGCIRENNEDIILIDGQQIRDGQIDCTIETDEVFRFTAIVADGMGGYEHGEVASKMAVTSFSEFLSSLPPNLTEDELTDAVNQWVKDINNEIISAANGSGMGCTFCGIFVYDGCAFLINIGDSRTYRLRHDYLRQLTIDHSERQRTGNPDVPSNLIYNALGVSNAFADLTHTRLIPGDRFVVCSDGLNDMIEDEQICELLKTSEPSAHKLVEAALNAGGNDNVSVIYLSVVQ